MGFTHRRKATKLLVVIYYLVSTYLLTVIANSTQKIIIQQSIWIIIKDLDNVMKSNLNRQADNLNKPCDFLAIWRVSLLVAIEKKFEAVDVDISDLVAQKTTTSYSIK